MYYKTASGNRVFKIEPNIKVTIDIPNNVISEMYDRNWDVAKGIFTLLEIDESEFNGHLNNTLSTLKINKLNFQFNGKK